MYEYINVFVSRLVKTAVLELWKGLKKVIFIDASYIFLQWDIFDELLGMPNLFQEQDITERHESKFEAFNFFVKVKDYNWISGVSSRNHL